MPRPPRPSPAVRAPEVLAQPISAEAARLRREAEEAAAETLGQVISQLAAIVKSKGAKPAELIRIGSFLSAFTSKGAGSGEAGAGGDASTDEQLLADLVRRVGPEKLDQLRAAAGLPVPGSGQAPGGVPPPPGAWHVCAGGTRRLLAREDCPECAEPAAEAAAV